MLQGQNTVDLQFLPKHFCVTVASQEVSGYTCCFLVFVCCFCGFVLCFVFILFVSFVENNTGAGSSRFLTATTVFREKPLNIMLEFTQFRILLFQPHRLLWR